MVRSLATFATADSRVVDSIVVGGGPAGLAVLGSLLEQRPQKRQLWVDPVFQAGRVGAHYRQVPSNTKVDLFVQFATKLAPFRQVVDAAEGQEDSAIEVLRRLPQDKGCELGYAADLCLMLTEGVARQFDNVHQHRGKVTGATFDKKTNLWTAQLDGQEAIQSQRLVLCTGSSPIMNPLPVLQKLPQSTRAALDMVHLDVALSPSKLAKTVGPDSTVAVVGASHSAILVLMNLYNLATTTHKGLRIKWFTRHTELRYAQFMDGWILYDNTGLKGQAAQWARDNLEESVFDASPVSKTITRFHTPVETEESVYLAELPGCTHVAQAIGYKRDPLPELRITGTGTDAKPQLLNVRYDDLTGRFFAGESDSSHVPGLFGAGIAFPERVTDPAGNTEHAVGFWKFMKFLNRVVPQWVAPSKAT